VAQALSNTIVVQPQVRRRGLAAPVDKYKVTTTFTPHPIRNGVQPARRREGPLRPIEHERLIATPRLDPQPQEDVPRRLPPDSLWRLRIHRSSVSNTFSAPKTIFEARIVRPGRARCEIKLFDPDGNRSPNPHDSELYVRSAECIRHLLQSRREVPGGHAMTPTASANIANFDEEGILHSRPQERHDYQRGYEHLPAEIEAPSTRLPNLRGRRIRDTRRGVGRASHAVALFPPPRSHR